MSPQKNHILNLHALLNLLYPPLPVVLPFHHAYDVLLQQDIRRVLKELQATNRQSRDYDHMGLCEFHTGLYHFFWDEFEAAAHHFHQANFFWSITNQDGSNLDSPVCLAYLAEGRANHQAADNARQHQKAQTLADQNAKAVRFYQQTEKRLDSLKRQLRSGRHARRLNVFTDQLEDHLSSASQQIFRDTVRIGLARTEEHPQIQADLLQNYEWFEIADTQGRPTFLGQFQRGDWVLAEKKLEDNDKYSWGNLLIVGKNSANAHIWIKRHFLLQDSTRQGTSQRYSIGQINEWERDLSGNVTIRMANMGDGPKPMSPGHIEGLVITHYQQSVYVDFV